MPEANLDADSSERWFSVDVQHATIEGAAVVRVLGDLDLVTAPQLAEQAALAAPGDVVIDLGGVTFIDSTGLRALWSLRQAVASDGGRALLRSPSEPVIRVLRTTKLEKVFEYADDAGD